jgi:hypothetical protein
MSFQGCSRHTGGVMDANLLMLLTILVVALAAVR